MRNVDVVAMLGTDGEVLLLVDLGLGLVALPDDLVVAALVDDDRAQLALVPLLPQAPGTTAPHSLHVNSNICVSLLLLNLFTFWKTMS